MTRKTRVLAVFGTRPEAIKMAPVVRALQASDAHECIVCVTAQHREMLDQVMQVFDLQAHHDLDLMTANQSLDALSARVLQGVSAIIDRTEPDWVLVHGDTTTTMASSMAAFYKGVSIGHVEAGLRTHDISSPWPEEFNRRVAGLVSTLHFAPTERAAANLLNEGAKPETVLVTGNTVVDALLDVAGQLERNPEMRGMADGVLPDLDAEHQMVLVTGHRRENIGSGFQAIIDGLERVAGLDGVDIVFPVHLNPKVRDVVHDRLANRHNVHLLPPLDYVPFVNAMRRASLIITDSGGIQEEAPSLGVPVLVTRDVTERPEGLGAGRVELVGANAQRIFERTRSLLQSAKSETASFNPYGDGRAAERIVDALGTHQGA